MLTIAYKVFTVERFGRDARFHITVWHGKHLEEDTVYRVNDTDSTVEKEVARLKDLGYNYLN